MAAMRGNTVLTAATRATVHRYSSRSFSSCRALRSYDDTVQNLRIGKHTRVIYQVFDNTIPFSNCTVSNSLVNRDSLDELLPEMLRTAWSTVPTL
jgi:succinyl-CoA synthetase alpha subunit